MRKEALEAGMEIMVENRSGVELPIDHVEELARFVLEAEALPKTTELSISFVDIDEITELNATYRGKSEPTDVLSFELDDPWQDFEKDDPEQLLIGDIVINADIAAKHARYEEVSLEEELWILVIHGLLHLIGYDHVTPDDTQTMEGREDDYFYRWELRMGI